MAIDWEKYYLAALEELESFRSRVVDPECRESFHAKVGSEIIMAVAVCEPPMGLAKSTIRAMAFKSMDDKCRKKAEIPG